MFLLDDGVIVYSASDLAAAAQCEFALLRVLDGKLGRCEPPDSAADAMLERAARLGDQHEERVLATLEETYGPWDSERGTGVARIERPVGRADRTLLLSKREETLDVLRTGADVVFQAGFFDGRSTGWADFLVRDPADEQAGGYAVYDTKLARHAKVTALLQLAAYADQLLTAAIPTAPQVHLWLGDSTITSHRLDDLLPVYRERRARLERLLDAHRAGGGPVEWGEPGHRACLRCGLCEAELEVRRDVLLVAGLRSTQRARLHRAGVTTIDALAAGDGAVEGVGAATMADLRAQARLQVAQRPPEHGGQQPELDGHRRPADGGQVRFEIHTPQIIAGLPPASDGDIFFDFEGDPLWSEKPGHDEWGLEYLFGVIEAPVKAGAEPVFRAFWAHDRGQEKRALLDFLTYVEQRRARHPDMHVYHYAPYERSALLRLAGRHGVGEEAVDHLLREGTLVDLYATVRGALRTGQPSYSLKALEPLYLPGARSGEVTTGGDSIVEYAEACAARDAGDLSGWQRRIGEIEDYNHIDCVSTLWLRDWLVAQATALGFPPAAPGVATSSAPSDDDAAPERDELAEALLAFADRTDEDARRDTGDAAGQAAAPAGPAADDPAEPAADDPADPAADDPAGPAADGPSSPAADDPAGPAADGPSSPAADGPAGRDADRQAVAMLAAALGYHWREDKPFWWGHFDRLGSDPAEWADTRDTFLADEAIVDSDWQVPAGRRTFSRRVRMVGRVEPGSELKVGDKRWALYEPPLPDCAMTSLSGHRGWTVKAVVVEVSSLPDGRDAVVVEEGLRKADPPHDCLPMALVPTSGPPTGGIRAAIERLAEQVRGSLPLLPRQPALDILRRLPPRLSAEATLPVPAAPGTGTATATGTDTGPGTIEAITAAVLDLDSSYLAVQGPPGTGKTHVGSRVVAGLVNRGWRIGVVAQSHAVVENMLGAVSEAGVPSAAIGKKRAGGSDGQTRGTAVDAPWTWIPDTGFAEFYAANPGGYVVGGTAWDFVNARRLPAEPLDLLVIDEAGQFSLANTIAVSTAAQNLLLLGDPQQLPQVSQGRHPEPVDRSALGWLTDGHDTLPAELGYFLDRTWRMHPDLCAAVSRLSYERRLTSMAHTEQRSLDGVAPGVRAVLVEHEGNAVVSTEEAQEVLRQAEAVIGRRWRDPEAGVDRALGQSDVLVVAAYNAQVATIRRTLREADLDGVRVGTVDKFQGQQAPVVIVSMAASSPQDVPRGMEFLLNRNRINVAVSRGQWCAVVIRSPALTDYLPSGPDRLAELGAFLGLTRTAHSPNPALT